MLINGDGPYLITGAGGCIGAWVLKLLTDADIACVAFDVSADRHRPALLFERAADADAVIWETGDIADSARVAEVVERHRPTAIIHLAALQVPFCRADPAAGARANVVGTVNIFAAAARHQIRRLVYASSVAANAMQDESPWLKTLYGAYKICNEQMAQVYWQNEALPSIGIRPSVIYGPARDQGMSSKPTLAVLAAVAGLPYQIPFTGNIGFVYAAEAAEAFIQAATKDPDEATVFNLNGTPETVENFIALLKEHLPQADIGCDGSPLPFPADFSDAPLRAQIGNYRHFSLAEGLTETVALFTDRIQSGRLNAEMLLE